MIPDKVARDELELLAVLLPRTCLVADANLSPSSFTESSGSAAESLRLKVAVAEEGVTIISGACVEDLVFRFLFQVCMYAHPTRRAIQLSTST